MKYYPGLKASMGSWDYYIIKMNMSDIAKDVQFAPEGKLLDEVLQRDLKENRSKTSIVSYLKGHDDRFFNSIIIAALDGNPRWFKISIEDDERMELVRGESALEDTFGLLSFNGKQKFYALDGQHRLQAIKFILDPLEDAHIGMPKGFENEEISVVLVFPKPGEDVAEFQKKYRRLFGHLNRYAKPMDAATTIIIEEDDAFAIATRRLFTEHDFFKILSNQKLSPIVKMEPGKNLTQKDPYLTNIETLYSVNKILLNSNKRKNDGWYETDQNLDQFMRFRPEDEVLENIYTELSNYWSVLLDIIPVLKSNPSKMRDHDCFSNTNSDTSDNLLFWPIGQELLANFFRHVLDSENLESDATLEDIKEKTKFLGSMNWSLFETPWRNILLIPYEKNELVKWKMRNEDRVNAIQLCNSLFVNLYHSRKNNETFDWDNIKESVKKMMIYAPNETNTKQYFDDWWVEFIDFADNLKV